MPANPASPAAAGGPRAVLFATVLDADGAPAAAQPWNGGTVLGRLLAQLADLGVSTVHVFTRPGWEPALQTSLAVPGLPVELHTSAGLADDLDAVASLSETAADGLVVSYADLVTDREALAGLLADPRPGTKMLGEGRRSGRAAAFDVRADRDRVLSAASPYHSVRDPNAAFLGVLRISPADRGELAQVTGALAALSTPADVPSLLLVALLRSGVPVSLSDLRDLFWARPLSRGAAEVAAGQLGAHDADRALLDSSVKASDGFFTTFFVSPYSKYIARWAARRGWSPNQVTLVSLGIGVLAALAFGTGERAGLIAGAVLLQVSFTLDCVDGQLARYTRSFSRLGGWLDLIFDRTKEYLIFAALAIGASRTGDPVWLLAASALALQAISHAIDLSDPITEDGPTAHDQRPQGPRPPIDQPGDASGNGGHRPRRAPSRGVARWAALDRWPGLRWVKKIVAFPIGERFAVISITAAVASAHTTFVVLLAWGGVAAVYKLTGRTLRSLAR
jgi:hypothetical protein